jgi:hypothetical protein
MRLGTLQDKPKTTHKFTTMLQRFSRDFTFDLFIVLLINAVLGVTK